MPFHALLVHALAPLLVSAAVPSAPRGTDIDRESAEALAEILASDAFAQEAVSPNDDGRWALSDLLARGVNQTPTLEHVIAELARPEDLGFMRNETWLEALEREQLVAKLRLVPSHQAREASQHVAFDIPIADHPLVDTYIDYFTGRGRWFFERWLARADRYIPLMLPILEKHGLPRDLVYVAMIESGFAAGATSWARASGFWQFIVSTGRLYKLRTDVWVDERRDFIRSTEAAATYLGNLYQEFGDWHLAWASYNAGEGRIRRAIARTGAKDFWTISSHPGVLARETQHYVPKIIAAAIIAKDRARYGFADVQPLSPLAYDEIEVEDATELGAVARKFGFDLDDLREMNPALVYGVTPPGRKATLRVPAGRGAEVSAWLAGLPRSERLSYAHYKVEKGDHLSGIARRYGSSVDAIKDFNHIANVKFLRLGQVLVIPVPASARRMRDVTFAAVAARPAPESAARPETTPARRPAAAPQKAPVRRHKVADGETLWSIAQRYGVSVSQVRSWNAMHDDRVKKGEVLQIFAEVPKT